MVVVDLVVVGDLVVVVVADPVVVKVVLGVVVDCFVGLIFLVEIDFVYHDYYFLDLGHHL